MMKAVWLFSRNNAIGNALIVAAVIEVAISGSSLPDLFVTFAIAGFFLQSSWIKGRNVLKELRKDSET